MGVAVIGAVIAAVSGSGDCTTSGFQAGLAACAAFSTVIGLPALAPPRSPRGWQIRVTSEPGCCGGRPSRGRR